MLLFFFKETRKMKEHESDLLATLKDLSFVFHHRVMRTILIATIFFCIGWAFYIVFIPTFLVQKFGLDAEKIGDIFAYMGLSWTFASMYLNKELNGKFSLRSLILFGLLISSASVAVIAYPDHLWPYWILIPISMIGGAVSWVNLSSLISMRASESMQGRVMGANSSTWSIGQIVAPLLAGPLAGWNLYSPLLFGATFIFIGLIYFTLRYREA
jgi:predicted MFS family arabinose efflux permease